MKLFGENIPSYSVVVSINNIPLASTGLTMANLGLTDITYTSSANENSNRGLYYRRGHSAVTDLNNPQSLALSELYNYQFVDGVLTINRMPLTVTPKDTTLVFGAAIKGKEIQFDYVYDALTFH